MCGDTYEKIIIKMTGITKRFINVHALKGVDLTLRAGEALILVGENGAGKSTLMKILAGVYKKDDGTIEVGGRAVQLDTPSAARNNGISIVFQEQALAPDLTALENIFIGSEITRGRGSGLWKRLDRQKMLETAKPYLDAFSVEIDMKTPVRNLSLVQKQVIEITRGLVQNASVFVLDEPTAALEEFERNQLFSFLKKLKESGVGIIFCSHHLEECLEIGDRVMVLRDGECAGEVEVRDTTVKQVIEMMIGKSLSEQYPKEDVQIGGPILEAIDLTHPSAFRNLNFTLHSGEILGIGGLTGSGKSELARTLFGAERLQGGRIRAGDRTFVEGYTTLKAVAAGLAFLPADRKSHGLFLDQDVRYNITISNLKELLHYWLDSKKESEVANRLVDSLAIKTPDIYEESRNLSGGNQQKVMLARWLFKKPKVLIFTEPTRGIDVNAKVEVYRLIGRFVRGGGAVIVVSSDLPELEGICDRVLIMRRGEIAAEIPRGELTQEKIALYCISTEGNQ